MKKHILTLEETHRSFQCFAIQSELADYELAFCINAHLSISLERIPDHKLRYKDRVDYSFTAFVYDDEGRMAIWSLISNVSHPQIGASLQPDQSALFENEEIIHRTRLLPDFKSIDYWLLIDCDELDLSEEVKKLRMQAGITSILKIDIHSSKYWSNLLLF
ncbi:MAG: IPExxxVDY family protein [Thermaurantimonas sp.]|uniref:IPExxxVDY family protein n=1 Tax=Thermaurantimonas sp. TaxID=2681568 RepID=UPI00391A24D6